MNKLHKNDVDGAALLVYNGAGETLHDLTPSESANGLLIDLSKVPLRYFRQRETERSNEEK